MPSPKRLLWLRLNTPEARPELHVPQQGLGFLCHEGCVTYSLHLPSEFHWLGSIAAKEVRERPLQGERIRTLQTPQPAQCPKGWRSDQQELDRPPEFSFFRRPGRRRGNEEERRAICEAVCHRGFIRNPSRSSAGCMEESSTPENYPWSNTQGCPIHEDW